MSLEMVYNIVKILCGVMAMVNLVQMISGAKERNHEKMVECGFLAIIMTLLWKL